MAEGIPLGQLKEIESTTAETSNIRFVESAADLGVDFTSRNGAAGRQLMSEATGSGCGVLDFDVDGVWDLYLVQSGTADAEPGTPQPLDQLYRGDDGRFQEVAGFAGIDEPRYGQGVAIGDYDNDGFDDIFVTNIGPNTLWHNQGDGTFVEITNWGGESSGLWSSSAAWGDVDGDGDLDLYVCNYVDFDPRSPIICRDAQGEPVQCQPNQVDPVPDEFYENLSDGTFRECSAKLGLAGPENRALGVVIADLLGDRRPEIYVANDASPNFLFASDGLGKYTDVALRYGCAVDANGRSQASMGIDVGDFDRNGWLDLYLTHFEGEWNTFYGNFGEEGFRDVTGEVGAVQCTLPWVGFGVVMTDFDLDGNEDVFIANGHIDDKGRSQVLAMPPQLLSFDGNRWTEVSGSAGRYFQNNFVGRGCSRFDFDRDGDEDLAVVHQNSLAEILRNESRHGRWVGLRFVGRGSNRRGIGTRVTAKVGQSVLAKELIGGGSYCSSNEPSLVFGLGHAVTERVTWEIRWPGGRVQQIENLAMDRWHTLIEPDDDNEAAGGESRSP